MKASYATKQTEVDGTLVIEPATDADRAMFACGSLVIRPNSVFYPNFDSGEDVHFETETSEPWQIVSKVRGLAIAREYDRTVYPVQTRRVVIYGERSLINPRESGHDLEGSVSVAGRKHRAFTSSQLFESESGQLVDVAVLHVCNLKDKTE